MKKLHRDDLYMWSVFDETRNIDFNSILWVREAGNVVIDPLPLSEHDAAHLEELGGVSVVIVTNSDHLRDARALGARYRAQIMAPRKESQTFPVTCERWLGEGDEAVPGLKVVELHGSKTAGELALVLDGSTLITGDLIRCHQAGALCLLPDPKLSDRDEALASVARLAAMESIEAVIVGDGFGVFRRGHERLRDLLDAAR